jgi:hypothetical protein
VNGNVTTGGGVAAIAVTGAGTTLTVNGNITTGNTNNAHGISITALSPVTVNGNLENGTGNGNAIFANIANAVVTVNGNVTGGTSSTGINLAQSGVSLTVTGNVYASTQPGINSGLTNSPLTVDVNGDVYATNAANGISLASGQASVLVRIGGVMHAAKSNVAAVYARRVFANPAGLQWHTKDDQGSPAGATDVWLVADGDDENPPAEADVRDGTTYGGVLEGTLVVPDPADVIIGVPTDDTVGTATSTPAAVWDYLTADADTAASIGVRIRDAATVASTGEQLEAAS